MTRAPPSDRLFLRPLHCGNGAPAQAAALPLSRRQPAGRGRASRAGQGARGAPKTDGAPPGRPELTNLA